MGANFSKKFPLLFKYGVYRQSLQFYKKNNYDKAYARMAEVFRMDDIKKFFNPEQFRPIDEKSIFFLH